MSKIITYEEACKIPRLFDSNKKFTEINLYKEASENGACFLLQDTNLNPPDIEIIYKMENLGENIIGLYISVYDNNHVIVYDAMTYQDEIYAGKKITEIQKENLSLNTVISIAKEAMNICPICGKETPYIEQSLFSFAGRCCKDCLPEMKRKYEQPGWYN